MNRIFTGLLAVIAIASLIGNGLLYQRYSTNRPLVTVGSDVIKRKDYADALDYQVGKPVLNKMVYASLVSQAAKKANLFPTDADVEKRIDQIKRRNPQQLAAANNDPNKMADLKRDIATDIALENLRIQNVKLQPGEIEKFYNSNKNAFTLPVQAQTTLVVTGVPIGGKLVDAAQAATDAATARALLSGEHPIKPDVIAHQPRLFVAGINGFSPQIDALPAASRQQIAATVFKMKDKEVRTIPIKNGSQQMYFTFRVNKGEGQRIPSLSDKDFHNQVERLVKLTKAPGPAEELSKLYNANKPRFDVGKYAGYFSDIESYKSPSTAQGKTASSR